MLENEEERTLAEKKALTAMMLERTRMLNQTAMDKSRTEQDGEQETLLERSLEEPGRRTELHRPMRRKGKKVSTAAFKSVTRNECFVQKMYYGPKNVPAPGHYRPDYTKVKYKNPSQRFLEPSNIMPRV